MRATEQESHPRTLREAQRAARRERFIECAEKLFLRDGYARTSVNTVVRLAGGSLATLYAEFKTKEALFEAVIARRAASAFPPRDCSAGQPCEVRQALRALAARLHARALSPNTLAIYRLAISEGPRLRSVRTAVLERGLDLLLARLAEIFSGMNDAGILRVADAALAASRFVALVHGQHQFIGACGATERLPGRVRSRHVEAAVDAFLEIYAPPAPAPASRARGRRRAAAGPERARRAA
jgi:AcrR family transcriptional regulator